jgi:hypothetical protein
MQGCPALWLNANTSPCEVLLRVNISSFAGIQQQAANEGGKSGRAGSLLVLSVLSAAYGMYGLTTGVPGNSVLEHQGRVCCYGPQPHCRFLACLGAY